MAFISAGVWALGRAGLEMDPATLLGIVGPLWGYIAGQSVVDFKKSAAEIEATSAARNDNAEPAEPEGDAEAA